MRLTRSDNFLLPFRNQVVERAQEELKSLE